MRASAQALELLVQRTNKPQYWSQLLDTAAGTKGLSDHGTLDVYRLKLLTGSLTKPEDYSLLAQLALQLGFAAESAAVIQKATDAKVQMGGRTGALLTMAKGQAAANAANAARITASGNGDALVKLGEDAWGQGRFPDAVKLVQAGIKKGVTDKANAQIRLGMAYLGSRPEGSGGPRLHPGRRPQAKGHRPCLGNLRPHALSGLDKKLSNAGPLGPAFFISAWAWSRASPPAWSTDRCARRCRARPARRRP